MLLADILCEQTKPVTVQCDASQRGLGAETLQIGKPVEYALPHAEKGYAQCEKELLSFLFGLERFHTDVFGWKVTVQTEHKLLNPITKKSLTSAPKWLQRMMLCLRCYNFKLVWLPRSPMILAGMLSRAYPNTPTKTNQFTEELAMLDDVQMS